MCNCKKQKIMETMPIPLKKQHPVISRSGACPYCLRKHLLKARGYARELREDGTREWERENLLENLLLAEDHAEALGDAGFKAEIRQARLRVEDGGLPDTDPLLARAREKILESQRVAGVENKAEPARTEEH